MAKQVAPLRAGNDQTVPSVKKMNKARALWALFKAMRPRQWIKNLLLFAGVVFTGSFPGLDWFQNPEFESVKPLLSATAGFLIFCLLSSGVYLLNDVRDVEKDRQHPVKRNRPIAAGLISPTAAIITAVGLWIIAAAFGIYLDQAYGMLGWKFGFLALLYLSLQFAYTTKLKYVPILDVCIIASGFVIRAMAGAAAIYTYISTWLIICTGLLSLLIGFGKRRHELLLLGKDSAEHRSTLGDYSLSLIDQMLTISAAGTIVMYSIYTIQSYTAMMHQRLYWTIPPVIYAVFRYLFILHQGSRGGSPEKDLLEDKHMLFSIVLWIILAILALKLPQFSFGQ